MKQRFSSLDVRVIAQELSSTIVSLRVANIYDLSSRIFLLKLAKPGSKEQLLVDSGFRCHLTSFARTTAAAPSAFVSKLRRYLKTRRITAVSQIGTDRVVELEFSDGQYRLYLEFFSAGNIVLTDKEYNILALLRNVSEGSEDKDVKLGIQYPIKAKQNYGGKPSVTEHRIREALEGHIKRAEAMAEVNVKTAKKKTADDLRKAMATGFPEYPPHLLDHAFNKTSLDASARPVQALEDVQLLSKLIEAVALSDRIFQSLGKDGQAKGYIIAKVKDDRRTETIPTTKPNLSVQSREDLLYDDFHPFKPSQYENMRDLVIFEQEGFNKTVDEFYSSIESQRLESRLTEREENAKRKIETARREHEKRLGALQQVQEVHIRKAEAIEANAHRVEEAIAAMNGLIGQGMDWMDIAKLIENEKTRQNVVAQMIKLPLKLYENTVTLLLDEAAFEEEGEEEGYETEELSGSDEEDGKAEKKPTSDDSRLAIDIDLALSPWANARQYYDQKRSAAQKEQKTLQASSRALKSTEQKISADLKKGLKQEKDVLRPARKQFWFEKFWYFISSDGYLVLGGKDAQQSELLYRRYLKKGDVYVHADLQGAASVIVKNAVTTPDAPIPPSSLSQAGSLAVCTSSAWDSKAVMAAWWVNADQVSKTAPTGEHLVTGGFMIKGQKNFLPPAQLLLGFAVAFQISDDSKANHHKHRLKDVDKTVADSGLVDVSDQVEEEGVGAVREIAGDRGDQTHEEQSESDGSESEPSSGNGKKQENIEEDELDQTSDADGDDADAPNPLQARGRLTTEAMAALDSVDGSHSEKDGQEDPAEEESQFVEDVEEPLDTTSSAKVSIPESPSSTPPSQSHTTASPASHSSASKPIQAPAPRGKNTKAAKRAAARYEQQDPSERALALQLLGSTKAQEKKQAAAVDKAARDAKAATDRERRKAQHERAAIAERKRQERLAADDGAVEEDDAGDRDLIEQERRELTNLDALVANPLPDDELLAALPIVAPWSALARYKYKIKLQPGSVKKGKAVREIVGRWVEAGKMGSKALDASGRDREKVWPKEMDCIRAWRVEEMVGCLPVGKVRIVQGGGAGGGGGTGGSGGKGGKGGKGKGGAGGGGSGGGTRGGRGSKKG